MEEIDFRLKGLAGIFTDQDLTRVLSERDPVLAILSYFATSLFDKNTVNDVLWDITANCISQLELEDCVIYLLDEKSMHLKQRAAYGHKDQGQRKILEPITIPLGEGIVGNVAKTGTAEIVDDVTQDDRYILDDIQRGSELTVPIVLEGKVIGVLDTEHSQKHFYTPLHLFLFDLIAQLTAKKLSHLNRGSKLSFTNDNAYYLQLLSLLENEKIYRDPYLSLGKAAEQLSISANYLSQMVNHLSGCSFCDLINHYRITEAMQSLSHPDFNDYTVEGIGYESGFNSPSTFYSAFKKHTGVTPSAYRKHNSSF